MAQEEGFKIVVTTPAQKKYQETILAYLSEHFSIERAADIDLSISRSVASLTKKPYRGTIEKYLDQLANEFRFILHKESRHFEIKIIYFVSQESKTVFVTDFFPTRMNPQHMNTP